MAHKKDERLVEVVIEIPRGSRNKYEYDVARDIFFLDRVLYSSVHYPTDYGFIYGTMATDGDPLDVLLVVEDPTFTGCHLRARPIGVLYMRDEKGEDPKILAVPADDPRFEQIFNVTDISSHWRREIEQFFATYKALEGLPTEVLAWQDVSKAWEMIDDGFSRAKLMAHDSERRWQIKRHMPD